MISIGFIHNDNEARNKYLRPHIENLSTVLSENWHVERFEICRQPEIRPHNLRIALLRDVMYHQLGRKWSRYRSVRTKPWIVQAVFFIKRIIGKYILDRNLRDQWTRDSYIETLVTDKHIRGWNAFMETQNSFLLCLEDDAVFLPDTSSNIERLIRDLSARSTSPTYVDIGGGCDLRELGIDRLEIGRDACFRYYGKPVTNTACAYLLNRSICGEFLRILVRKPWLRLVGIDWMMNSLFMTAEDEHLTDWKCQHADPPMIIHGTAAGHYSSWQKRLP